MSTIFINRTLEICKESGFSITSIHLETIFRAMTEIIIDRDDNITLRRLIDKEDIKEIFLMGLTEVGKNYPSWLKRLGFGWIKQCLEEMAVSPKESLNLPSERILEGKLIIS